jgi:serine/threonine protein kinase
LFLTAAAAAAAAAAPPPPTLLPLIIPHQVRFEYAPTYLLSGSYDVQTPGYRAPEALLRCSFNENMCLPLQSLITCHSFSITATTLLLERAIILNFSDSFNSDVWSIGVVLVELLMSERLVPEGAENMEAVRSR